jgi:hypothetical protein
MRIDADLITRYIDSCSSFRAKATVYGTLSTMRGFATFCSESVPLATSRKSNACQGLAYVEIPPVDDTPKSAVNYFPLLTDIGACRSVPIRSLPEKLQDRAE